MFDEILAIIKAKIGSRSDTASATGSLHAKVKNIVDNELPKTQRARGVNFTTFNTTNETLTTVLSVSGRGELLILRNRNGAPTTDLAEYEITIDGTVVFHAQTGLGGLVAYASSYGYSQLLSGHALIGTVPVATNTFLPNASYPAMNGGIPPIPFNTSLLIKAKRVGTNSVYCEVVYSLEE